ncbi:MAG TPA: MFS transporter [Thermoanaerobaculia bacterium]|nr:MFS transporter [Thermoanaerobaculia bacterium]
MSTPRLLTPRFAALWIFQFATFFSVFQLLPVIPLRILDLGGSKAAAGSFLAVYTFASAFAAPAMGTIADHVGRRRMLIIASILFIVFSLLYGIVPWLPLVLLIGVAHGTLWSAILSSAGAIMTDYIPVARRTEGLAYWGLAPTAAIAIAPAVGLYVYRLGWLALCCELAALSAITAIWASRLPETALDEKRTMPPLRELWDWQVARATLSLAVVAFGHGGVTSYVAILSLERGIKPESLFFTVFALSTIFIRIVAARLGDRFGPKVLLYPAFAAIPVSFAILAVATTREQMIASAILFGFGMGLSFPAFMTFVVTNTDERRRGRTFGSVIWAFDTGIGIGSLAVGVIGQRHGLGAAFGIAAALSCLSIPIFVATTRQMARGTAVAGNGVHAGTG